MPPRNSPDSPLAGSPEAPVCHCDMHGKVNSCPYHGSQPDAVEWRRKRRENANPSADSVPVGKEVAATPPAGSSEGLREAAIDWAQAWAKYPGDDPQVAVARYFLGLEAQVEQLTRERDAIERQRLEQIRRYEDLGRGKDRALSNEIRAKTEARNLVEQLRLRNQTMREALGGWETRDCGNGQSVLERGVGEDCERLCGPIPYDCAVDIEGFLAALAEGGQRDCPRCEGKELIETAASTAEHPNYAPCPDCGGTGVAEGGQAE